MVIDVSRQVCVAFGMITAAAVCPALADVVTDGTAGPRVRLDGDFEIGVDLGTRAGRNLFHSFERFSLDSGERATFSGPDTIRNVISRVTGGERSDIDGTIASTIPVADFYFLNPAGVMFGPNARLDLLGSFHVATADELRFADGTKFSATDAAASSFTVAAPEAFGFLGRGNGRVNIAGSVLEAPSRETVSLVGGDIRISSGTITIPQGRLNLVAKKSAGEVGLEDPEIRRTGRGDVVITDQSQVDLGGFGSGIIHVRAGAFVVAGSDVAANNSSVRTATGRIDIDADEVTVGTGGRLRTDVFGSGAGGRVTIVADRIEVSGGGLISARTFSEGGAGRVDLTAGELQVRDRGEIRSSAIGEDASGAAGQVNVIVDRLEMSGSSFVEASSLDGAPGRAGHLTIGAKDVVISGLASGLFAGGADDGGRIVVEAGTLRMVDGSLISARGGQGDVQLTVGTLRFAGGGRVDASTTGARPAGNVVVQADTISIIGTDSGLFANSEGQGAGAGAAGLVAVKTGGLVLQDQGGIAANSFGRGGGGSVTLHVEGDVLISGGRVGTGGPSGADEDFGAGAVTLVADRVLIEGGGEIAARGTQGAVTVRASELTLTNGGHIEIDVSGVGQGGNITVGAGSVVIAGRDVERDLFSGLLARSDGRGRSGDIEVRSSHLTIEGGGQVSTIAFGDGRGGDIRIDTRGSIAISGMSADGLPSGVLSISNGGADAGSIAVRATDSLAIDGGRIRSSSVMSGGGGITIRVGELVDLRQGAIESSVFGGAGTTAGDIMIDPRFLVLDRSGIIARAAGGRGGNIRITADNLIVSPGSVINAEAGDEGIDGTVVVSTPEVDLSVGLVVLEGALLDAASQLRERCGARRDIGASSFTGVGRGGLPASPDGPLTSTYPDLRMATSANSERAAFGAAPGALATRSLAESRLTCGSRL